MAESSGNANAVSNKGAVGLMQILPSTAEKLDSSLSGLSDSAIAAKLKDPNYNIQLGTYYYRQLRNDYGNNDLASSAYNGGYRANAPSVNCPGIRRWECRWDSNGCWGTSNTNCTPNTGYKPTRDYVPRINTFESQINNGQCT